jgi:histone H3/H4
LQTFFLLLFCFCCFFFKAASSHDANGTKYRASEVPLDIGASRFNKLVKEIYQPYVSEPLVFSRGALLQLRAAADAYFVGLFHDANVCAINAKSPTLHPKHMQLAQRIQGGFVFYESATLDEKGQVRARVLDEKVVDDASVTPLEEKADLLGEEHVLAQVDGPLGPLPGAHPFISKTSQGRE